MMIKEGKKSMLTHPLSPFLYLCDAHCAFGLWILVGFRAAFLLQVMGY